MQYAVIEVIKSTSQVLNQALKLTFATNAFSPAGIPLGAPGEADVAARNPLDPAPGLDDNGRRNIVYLLYLFG